MCDNRTTVRDCRVDQQEAGLAVRNWTQMAGWLSGPLLLQLLQLLRMRARSRGRGFQSFTLIQFGSIGTGQRQRIRSKTTKGKFSHENQRGQELYCTCRWHPAWGNRSRKNESRVGQDN